MASKQQAWEQEALKETYWELVAKREKFPENVHIPWKTKNEDGDTLAHIYARYAVLPDSFSEWKLCSRRTGKTVAEVAIENNTLPESFDRYDLFPILFHGHSLYEVKKEFDNIPSLKNDIKVLSDEIERLEGTSKYQPRLEPVQEQIRQDLSDRIEKSVEQTSAELRAEREKEVENPPMKVDTLIDLGVIGGVTLLGLLAIYFSSKMESKL